MVGTDGIAPPRGRVSGDCLYYLATFRGRCGRIRTFTAWFLRPSPLPLGYTPVIHKKPDFTQAMWTIYLRALSSYVKPELAFSCEFSKFFGGVKRLCSSCCPAYAGLFELSRFSLLFDWCPGQGSHLHLAVFSRALRLHQLPGHGGKQWS